MTPEFAPFSFSTSWNWRGTDSGERIAREVLDLGFGSVELNYRVTETMVEGLRPFVERGELSVSSVHNVFPFVPDARFDTDSRQLGYRDEALRERAIELAIRSLEAGASLGARALVVHPGVVSPGPDEFPPGPSGLSGQAYDEELKRRWLSSGPASDEYRSLFSEFLEWRAERASGELERVLGSLERLAEHVVRNRLPLVIGIENRPMCFQFPDFAEMRWLLDRLEGAPVGMWFDTGHGAMLRHMGFFDDRAEAGALADRLVGMHIHDVDGVDDHYAPYTREGLDSYLGLIERSPLKVIELGVKNPREVVVRGMRRLQAALEARRAAASAASAAATATQAGKAEAVG